MARPARTTAPRTTAPRDDVRHGVRALLTAATGFHALEPEARREIASSLVRISSTAKSLAEQAGKPQPTSVPRPVTPTILAQAQSAGSALSGTAVGRVASTTRNILNAVSFPRFVGDLITGVFKAMNDSNQQQLTSYVELIRNVAATTEGFADANVGIAGARSWLAERFPGSFMVRGEDEDDGFDDPSEMTEEERAELRAERDANTRLVLRPNASMPSEAALRTALGFARGDSVPTGDPEALVGPARAAMARNRQQILSTMVMMGLQRIVIDSGRLNASMRFHIDASSAASDDRGSQFDTRTSLEAGARYQFGPWGAEAKVQSTIGYVSTERTQTEEEINVDLDLNSSVELIFRSDYVPLERLAGTGDVNRIRVNALNPEAEAERATAAREARDERRATTRRERGNRLDASLRTPPPPAPMTPVEIPEPGGGSGGEPGGAGNGGGSTAESPEPSVAPAPEGGATVANGGSSTAGAEPAETASPESGAAETAS